MEDDYNSAQEAFLVGRYLKENGLSETLDCFLKETPIKMVPKMPENMQSLPQILRGFRSLLKDRQELKEKRRRLQQYEEILNLLFEELRDVYNFQSPLTDSTFVPSADHEQRTMSTAIRKEQSPMKVSSSAPEGQSDLDGSDAQLIEDFCIQNLSQRPNDNSGRIVPVVLPRRVKQSNTSSSEGFCQGAHDGPGSSDSATRNSSNEKPQGQPVYSRARTLEHHYNRIREHRRLNGRSKHRFLEKPMSPISNFVAYSSLPVSSSKVCASSSGHNGRKSTVFDSTHKHGRSKKHLGADTVGRDDATACAALQSASWEESANLKNWETSCDKREINGREQMLQNISSVYKNKASGFNEGLTEQHHSNESAEANLSQVVCYNGNDVAGCDRGGISEIKDRSIPRFFQNKDRDLDQSSHQHGISRSITRDPHLPHRSISKQSSAWACPVDLGFLDAAESPAIHEGRPLLERKFQKHVSYGGGLHYKAFLREKFFSTRRKQGATIQKQELLIHHDEDQDCCSASSSSSLEDSYGEHSQNTLNLKTNNANVDYGGCHEPLDAASLATETANLLERLLPLVSDSGSMQSFIDNLDSRTPRSSPRDLHLANNGYWHSICPQPQQAEARPQGIDVRPSTGHGSCVYADEVTKEADMDDDSSVLAELEEAVGQTVDEILRRYMSVSPLSQPTADPH